MSVWGRSFLFAFFLASSQAALSSTASQTGLLPSDWRLPTTTLPSSYSLHIHPDLNDFSFAGALDLHFHVLLPTDAVVLNSKELSLDDRSFSLTDSSGHQVGIKSYSLLPDLERLVLFPESTLNPKVDYLLHLEFSGLINDLGAGLYRSNYTDKAGQTRWMAVTQLRPVHARRLFPCFDEPIFRAKFNLKITHDPAYYVVANTPQIDAAAHSNTGGHSVAVFEETPPIPPFLVAFIVSNIGRVYGDAGFSSMALLEKIDGATYSAEIGPKLATAMESYTGIRYPLEQTIQVALPRLIPVAMENWGLFTFREAFILYFEGLDKTIQKQTVARFSGHEIAHMWMGNPVSLKWWDYLWLSEVFAMYYEYYIPSWVQEDWNMRDQLVVDLHQLGLLDDSVPVAPLTTTVLTPEEISAKFGGVTYSKGPALLRMVHNFLTEEKYRQGFVKFLKDNAYGNVDPSDLWNTLEQVAGVPLPETLENIMHAWTHLSGYPVVTVKRDYDTGHVQLSQKHFSLNASMPDTLRSWWIPISWTTEPECNFAETTPKAWFPPQREVSLSEIVPKNSWIMLNIQSSAFYRVNYDDSNWEQIIQTLFKAHPKVHVLNRAQLLDDSLNLARGELIDYSVPLKLACYLGKEKEYVPWASALNAFKFLNDILIHSHAYPQFQSYMLTLLQGIYSEVGFDQKPTDGHLTKITRDIVVTWFCNLGGRDCVTRSSRYLGHLMNGKNLRIAVDSRDAALCTAVRVGGEREWNFILSQYNSAPAIEKPFYLNALACTNSVYNAEGFLIDSIPTLTPAEWNSRISAFAARPINVNFLLSLLMNARKIIESSYGPETFESAITSISGFLTTEEHDKHLAQLEATGLLSLGSVRAALQDRIAWLHRKHPEIQRFLDLNPRVGLVINK